VQADIKVCLEKKHSRNKQLASNKCEKYVATWETEKASVKDKCYVRLLESRNSITTYQIEVWIEKE